MRKYRWVWFFAAAIVCAACLAPKAAAQTVTVFYQDGFESYAVGEHPAIWGELFGNATDVVTNEWAATGAQSFVTAAADAASIKYPVVALEDAGALPLPDYFRYEGTLHMEATAVSSGAIGFLFVDPRNGTDVVAANAVAFKLDGTIVWLGPAPQVIGAWTPGTATTSAVRADINFLTGTADVYLDGVLAADDVAAWPKVIPASSIFGTAVTLDTWGLGLADTFSAPGPARVFIDDVLLAGVTPVEADVRFTPRTLNLKSKGRFVTVTIMLPEGFKVRDIERSSIFMVSGGSEAIFALAKPSNFSAGRGHRRKLMVKFVRSEVEGILAVGESVEIMIGGELDDETPFLGTDTIRVINPGKGPNGKGGPKK